MKEEIRMTGNKHLEMLSDFFNAKKRKQKKKQEVLKNILVKLETHQKKLVKQLETESNAKKIRKVKAQIKTIHLKRKKGYKLLNSLEKDITS